MTHLYQNAPNIARCNFGKSPDGAEITLFTLTNALGVSVKIINFGGIITEIHTPDKNGTFADIVLGFDRIEPYHTNTPYFGALIGRYGNRIAHGKFYLDGRSYQLSVNNGNNHLHGGPLGFDKVVWKASSFSKPNSVGLILKYTSADEEQGYPGNLQVTVIYELTNNNELAVNFFGITDKATPINLTQHSYFNLTGFGIDGNNDVLDHQLEVNADKFLPINTAQIPTGDIRLVAGTAFDFRRAHTIGERINSNDPQLQNGHGYDHTFVLNKKPGQTEHGRELSFAARATESNTGRVLEIFTDQPGIQFYSGNFLNGSLKGKGHTYKYRSGFCLEPQHFPDSPNQPQFPDTVLHPGEVYRSAILYRFSTL